MDHTSPEETITSPKRIKATLDDHGTLTVASHRIGANNLHTQLQQVDTNALRHNSANETAATSNKSKKLFPQKLWDLINDERYNFCLRWSDDGQLVYLNRDEFEDSYLKTPENQFHTQKAISFVRQMNMYGFRKVDDCYYENDNFKRNCDHLLKNMIRKHPNKNIAQTTINGNKSLSSFEHYQQDATSLPFNRHIQSDPTFYQATTQQTSLASSVAAAAATLLAQPVPVPNLVDFQHQEQLQDYPFFRDLSPSKQHFIQNLDLIAQQEKACVDQRNYFENCNNDDKRSDEDSISSGEDIDLTTTTSAGTPIKNQPGLQMDNETNLTAIYALIASLNSDLYQQQLANISNYLQIQQNICNLEINKFTGCHPSTPPPAQATMPSITQKFQDTTSNPLERQSNCIVEEAGDINYGGLTSDKTAQSSMSLLAKHKSPINNRGRITKRKLRPLNLSLRRQDL